MDRNKLYFIMFGAGCAMMGAGATLMVINYLLFGCTPISCLPHFPSFPSWHFR